MRRRQNVLRLSMYEIEQLSFSWGVPYRLTVFRARNHLHLLPTKLILELKWFWVSQFQHLLVFNFTKHVSLGYCYPCISLVLYYKAILGRNFNNISPTLRSSDCIIQREPSISRWIAKVHQWDDGPLHCDCERQLWKQSATWRPEISTGETGPKIWGSTRILLFCSDFLFLAQKRKCQTWNHEIFFGGMVFWWLFLGWACTYGSNEKLSERSRVIMMKSYENWGLNSLQRKIYFKSNSEVFWVLTEMNHKCIIHLSPYDSLWVLGPSNSV